jgi:hypothetical protein
MDTHEAVLKAFIVCDRIVDSEGAPGQMDLLGAGLSTIHASTLFPFKRTFWVYIELADQKPAAAIQLSLMRADSGRRLFFRVMSIEFPHRLQTTSVAVRVFDCTFPAAGMYFVELWYDGEWQIDQRLEVV